MKKFLSITSIVFVSALALVVFAGAANAASISSTQSGDWSNPDMWDTGTVPGSSDNVTITSGHTVTYDVTDSKISGATIQDDATLVFQSDKSVKLKTDKNILVKGTFTMRPDSASIEHFLQFVDVDETQFQGGGMDVLESDVGLWVRGDGVLDFVGTSKTSWTNLSEGANSGDTTITVNDATGWRVGDTISIAPTEHPDVGNRSWTGAGFSVRSITAIDGNTITLDNSLDHPHPSATSPNTGKTYTAEVMNLTRNVRVEGTGDGSADPENNGRAHIQILSSVAQTLKYIQVRHMGPRQSDGSYTENVLGRYPVHFHHSGDGSRGSIVKGTVVRNGGSHAYVPHGSHGITMEDTVAFNIWENAYWWDSPSDKNDTSNNTHDLVWDNTIAAFVRNDPSFRGYSLDGFTLGAGQNLTIRNSVVVGNQGEKVNAGGFHWPSKANQQKNNVWDFSEGNIAHNNRDSGLSVWQNDSNDHVVNDYVGYRNAGEGISHGAYLNSYEYSNSDLFDNPTSIVQHALPSNTDREDGYGMAFENIQSEARLLITKHSLASDIPILYKNCNFPSVTVDEKDKNGGLLDFVNCGLESSDFDLVSTASGFRVRVQREDGTAFKIDENGNVTTISAFYDTGGDEDTTEPTASIDSPSDGDTVSSTVDVTASASDDTGVAKVEFLIDGSVVSTDTTSPYSFSWDTTNYSNGKHTLKVRAHDDAGNIGSSNEISVDVSNDTDNTTPEDRSVHLDFDGSDDRVDLGGLDITPNNSDGDNQDLTIEAWIKRRSASENDARILSKSTGTANNKHYWMLSTSGNTSSGNIVPRFRLKTGGSTKTLIADDTSDAAISTDAWTHVAATYDGSEMKVYKDGTLVGSTSKTGDIDTNSSVEAWIGANPDSSNFWDGKIDEVRVWNAAQSQQAIQDNMNVELSEGTSGLMAYYKLNEGTGQTAGDSSGNGNDGTLGSTTSSDSADPTWVESDTSDTTAPQITDVQESNVTETSATISWLTDEPSDSQVEFGTDSCPCPNTTPLVEDMVEEHAIDLSGLDSGTTYHYRVHSTDSAGNEAISSEHTFTTDSPDTTPPSLSNIQASDVTDSSAKISWNTDEPATAQVEFGTDTSYGSLTPIVDEGNTSHSINLFELNASTTYHYRVRSEDASGNEALSSDHTFTTQEASPSLPGGTFLDFDGSDDLVDLGTPDVSGAALTIEAWIKRRSTSENDARILSKSTGTANNKHYWMLSTSGNTSSGNIVPRFRLKTGGSTKTLIADDTSDAAISTDAWTHVAATYDGSEMKVYKDGTLVGSTSKTGDIDTDSSVEAWIGANPDSSNFWDGKIDEVRVWNAARTQTQLQNSMNSELTGGETGLFAYYNLNEGTGQTAGDSSGNGRDGTLGSTTSSDSADPAWTSDQPDLITTDISWSPTNPEEGDDVTFSATIKNQGGASTPDGTVHGVNFEVDDTQVSWSSSDTSSLDPGESITVTADGGPDDDRFWNSATAGDHIVTATVDDVDRITESDETNNSMDETVTVQEADTTPPTLSNIQASNITESSATIIWDTDEPATAQVEFGTDTSYGSLTPIVDEGNTSHSIDLFELQAGTTYHYRVRSEDSSGNEAVSSDHTFTTQEADTTPPTSKTRMHGQGNITISASASDDRGVAKVELLVDGTVVATKTSSLFSFTWDSTTVANGEHIIETKAYDEAGNTGTSTKTFVVVEN